jgi:predicted dehydrogenase
MPKAAVIGLGRIGFDFGLDSRRTQPASHVACYDALSEIEAIAVCDTDQKKLKSAFSLKQKKFGYFADVNMMLQEFQPDIVSICTPTPNHAPMVKTVADYNCVKTVFLEKPIAQSLQEADAIINACEKRDITLHVNYTRRWSKIYNMTKDMLIKQNIIALQGIHPGPILRTGTHMIDLFNWFTAFQLDRDFTTISTTAFNSSLEDYMKGTDDLNINGVINYGDKQAWLIGQQIPYLLFDLTIICKDQRIQITNNGEELTVHKVYPSARYEKIQELKHVSTMRHVDEESILYKAIEEICKHLPTRCSGQAARRALHIALALHYSATHGNKTIELNQVPYDYRVRSY